MTAVLDVGCGQHKIANAIGMDRCILPGVDVVHDLDLFPYPFADNSMDEIHVNHVLEHVPDVMNTMQELWRICKPEASVFIRVPHFTGALAWKDPTHRRAFTSESFGYFGENGYSYYTNARFRVQSVRLQYVIYQDRSRWLSRARSRVVQWVLDHHPTFGERRLAYLVGGIDEIRVILRAVKSSS